MADMGATLSQRTVAVQVEIKKLGVRKKVASSLVKVRDQQDPDEETDVDALRVSKELLACKEYDAIRAIDSAFKARLMKLALPSILRRGVYLIPVDFVDRVDSGIRLYQQERQELVNEFVTVYGTAVEQARARLRTLFDPADYPPEEAVRQAFEVRVQYVSFDVPAVLARLNSSVFQRESAKLKKSMEEAAEEVRMYLRKGLMDLVSHLKDRLQDDPETGKPKVLRESTIENLRDWLSLFQGRNVTGDEDLAGIVEQCKKAIAGTDIESLRKTDFVRSKVAEDLASIRETLGTMIVDKPVRKFAWEDAA